MASLIARSALLAVVVALAAGLPALAQDSTIRVCVPFRPTDSTYITRCNEFFNTFANSTGLTFVCEAADSARACMRNLKSNTHQLARFGGDDMYIAGAEELIPAVAAEDYGFQSGTSYYGVAIVRKSFCDAKPTATFADLRGKRMCTTGYRRSAGWSMPVGLMMSEGIIPVVDNEPTIQNDAESVASFFSSICAPGTTDAGPRTGGGRYDELCDLCRNGDCSRTSPYADYTGAFQCLKDGAADVAFTKHDIPLADSSINQDDYRLLCRSGGCRPLSEFGACNVAKSAAHAMFVSSSLSLDVRTRVVNALVAAAASDAGRVAGSALNTLQGGARTPLPFFFQSTVRAVRPITENFESYFGAAGISAFRAIRNINVPQLRFCTVSAAEQEFCNRVVRNLNDQGLGFRFGCVQRASSADCIAAVKNRDAEALTADGGDIYEAHKPVNNLKVVVAEDYGLAAAAQQYYAVAVVTKQFCDANPQATLQDLRGKRSCHTGYKRSAGWAVPVGYMVGQGIMPVPRKDGNVQDDAEAVAGFFSKTCAGRLADNGPVMTPNGQGAQWEPLCTACKNGPGRCTTSDPYYDYVGAFRCLLEDSGDVAFTKHSIVTDYSKDGATPQPWSTKNMDDFRLLCPTGGCQPVTRASSCHISRVPAHAVMVRSDFADTRLLKNALVAASRDPGFVNLVFNRNANPNNLLFKSSAVALVAVDDDTRSFLGPALRVYEGLEVFADGGNTGAPVVPAQPRAKSDRVDLNAGEVAGIVIGCSVGLALIVAIIAAVIMRRREAAYSRYSEAPLSTKGVVPPSTAVALSSNMHGTHV